jgi:hypothetical protein
MNRSRDGIVALFLRDFVLSPFDLAQGDPELAEGSWQTTADEPHERRDAREEGAGGRL